MKITKQAESFFAVLMSIVDTSGFGTKKEVLDNIADKEYLSLNSADLQVKDNRNEIHWRNDLAFTRKQLVSRGYVEGREKNRWAITESGKELLQELSIKITSPDISGLNKLTDKAVSRARTYLSGVEVEDESINNTLAGIVSHTDADRMIRIRVGQGKFKRQLLKKDNKCKVCRLKHTSLLIASHIKPWKVSDHKERLDGNNGFLLCSLHDALFDRGYISFDDNGNIMISRELDSDDLRLLHIDESMKIEIAEENHIYLQWHREHEFEKE